jgi:hypothetical protein
MLQYSPDPAAERVAGPIAAKSRDPTRNRLKYFLADVGCILRRQTSPAAPTVDHRTV